MTALPWFKCFPQDLLNGMAGMPADERGIYISVLCLIYREGAPVRDEPREMAYNAGCTIRQWIKYRAALILHGKLKVVQVSGRDCISNDRCEEEIEAQRARRESFSERGEKGGKKRTENAASKDNENKGHAQANASAKSKLNQADIEEEEDKPPTPLEGGARRKPRKALPDDFPTAELIDEQQTKARTEGADLDVSAEAERFRNHALSTDRRCSDWSAAWRNWVLKAMGWAPKAPQIQPSEEVGDPWSRRLLNWRVNGYWNSEWGPKPDKPGYLGPAQELAA
jgi:uncharacterized protein YdaU (DUF1376 family)